MADLKQVKEELERVKVEHRQLREFSTSEPRALPRKDLSLQTLIRPWGGGEQEPVEYFLLGFSKVANNGGWTDAERLMVCRLKLIGAAANCISSYPELLQPNATFGDLEAILKNRFAGTVTPEEQLLALNEVEQQVGENVQEFADRCRRLGERTLKPGASKEESTWARGQIDRILVAAFIKGLRGEAGRQLRYVPPASFQEAVTRAARVEQAQAKPRNTRDVWAVQEESPECLAIQRTLGPCFK
uniref:Retrotransposon gag domain-containing protein n=1 Tax=Rhodnius prolixus TaxID=13249 RepID=T1I0X8_RHOPR